MDREALEQQLAALHADSFAWALACCDHRQADAEDALHTAYVRVLDGSARFQGRSTFRTWLFGVIRRTAAEHRRRLWWSWRLRNGTGWVHEAGSAPADEDRVERAEQAARLVAALAALSRRQREVLELVFYHDMTIAEASAVMGVSLGSARTHYERGKRSLARRLEQE